MKAPSPVSLRVLRQLVFADSAPSPTPASASCLLHHHHRLALTQQRQHHHLSTSRGSYLRKQSHRRSYATQKRPPPPPPRSLPATPSKPPHPAIKHPLAQPGFRVRGIKDDDEDFVPLPLSRPIGLSTPAEPFENTGLDLRSFSQRREDLFDYDKHLERRKTMTKQISKPYFRDWSNLRFHKGKMFKAPERLFRADVALYFPNFFGKTLLPASKAGDITETGDGGLGVGKKDGYSGLGRNTCDVIYDKVSVVSIVGSQWASDQVDTFCSKSSNPELHEIIGESEGRAQRVWIHREENQLRWWLVQMFRGNLRRGKSEEEMRRYFMVKRGVSEEIKESIGLLNDSVGYVYLVDGEGRIRWAGSAIAEEGEKESLCKGLRKLLEEAKTPEKVRVEKKKRLEEAVRDVTSE